MVYSQFNSSLVTNQLVCFPPIGVPRICCAISIRVSGQGPVSRKSRNFSGDIIIFVSSKRRRLEARNLVSSYFNFYSLQHMKRPALQNKQFGPEKFSRLSRGRPLKSLKMEVGRFSNLFCTFLNCLQGELLYPLRVFKETLL